MKLPYETQLFEIAKGLHAIGCIHHSRERLDTSPERKLFLEARLAFLGAKAQNEVFGMIQISVSSVCERVTHFPRTRTWTKGIWPTNGIESCSAICRPETVCYRSGLPRRNMELAKIETSKAPANPEIIRRHITVVKNPTNELSMREYSLRALEDNMAGDENLQRFVKLARASIDAAKGKTAKVGSTLAKGTI